MYDIDALISERKMEEWEFNTAMFAHLGNPAKSCGDMNCIYCATWADRLRDEQNAWDYDPANIENNS